MKILLTAINAKYIHSNLAVYSLKASAGEYASQVELAEFTINHRTEEILREIYLRKPDVLLFSCYIWNIEYVRELTAECRKVMPRVPIWLGGPEVSYDAEEELRLHPEVTGILTGEGEESFRLLVGYYVNYKDKASGQDFAAIPGAVYRSHAAEECEGQETAGEICRNPSAGLTDLSSIPFPYQDLKEFEHRIIYYESSRGCPFSCSYCLSSIDKSVRFRDLELVKRELQFFLDAKVPQVKFVDRTFNCRRSHALAIWRYLLEHDNGVTNFHFEIAADLLDQEELDLMAQMRPGLIQLEIGVQSTNPETIRRINRSMDLEKVKSNVARVRAMGNIHQHLDLIAGLPFEDYCSFAESFNQIYAMKPEQLQLGFLKVLKGSQMCREAESYGIVYGEKPPYEVLFTRWLSFDEVLKLKNVEEMVEVYYNSLQFRITLDRLVPLFSSPFEFFQDLADYYEEQGHNGRNHSRLQRYEILLDFIRSRLPEEENRFRELLTIDLYLREHVKSRPAFAPDQSPYRENIREILRRTGRQNHVEVVTENTEEITCLVFDYSRRSPLTGDAAVSIEKGAI
jgi:radical SAM superfamily enzyme YgiQ (UPF0313 family)